MRQTLLAAAADFGFSHFDTSPYYGFGIAEIELGRFFRCGQMETTVASKVGLYPPGKGAANPFAVWGRKAAGKVVASLSRPVVDWSVNEAERSLNRTLSTLGRDRVDILFLHEPMQDLLDVDEFLGWLARQKRGGKIRFWGLAGSSCRYRNWISHPLAEVIQLPDGDVAVLAKAGRQPQFTYGALSSTVGTLSSTAALEAALERNQRGAVVVSSRKAVHLRELANATESLCRS
jgi:aryl-alcohol dehydrogenase-like predicted oxidoreductase